MSSTITLGRKGAEKRPCDEILEDPRIVLDVDDLTFAYNPKKGTRTILKDVSIEIRGAQLFSILGPNGVGKSTFIHCLNRLLDPTEGSVMINGLPISDIPLKDMARISGYVPYATADSFPLSVTDTILMGRHPHSRVGSLDDDLMVVEDVLRLIGIEDLADRMFNELSAGQHQKVSSRAASPSSRASCSWTSPRPTSTSSTSWRSRASSSASPARGTCWSS